MGLYDLSTSEGCAELAGKASYEGGWPEYILGYGLSAEQVTNPPEGFIDALNHFKGAWTVLEAQIQKIEAAADMWSEVD